MKKHIVSKIFIGIFPMLILFLFTACQSDTTWDTSQQGNSSGNLANLGLAAEGENSLYLIGTTSPHDLIYKADEAGDLEKAITGLTGYIQFLNIQEDTFYFLGITYDNEENRSEGIFSADLNGENQSCLYNIESDHTVTHLVAVGELLICAVEDKKEKTEVRAIYPTESSEAMLFSENHPIRSLLIQNGSCYYITENKIICRGLDGGNRRTILESDARIGNMVTDGSALYYTVFTENGDSIEKCDLNGEHPKVLLEDNSFIQHMNISNSTLCFTNDQNNSEGELIQATLRTIDLETGEITDIATIDKEYIGISVIGRQLICHLNDDALTARFFELP